MAKQARIHKFLKSADVSENILEKIIKEMDESFLEDPLPLFEGLEACGNNTVLEFEEEELIFLEDGYYLIDGSEHQLDFIVSRRPLSLAALLENGNVENQVTFGKNKHLPLVRDVETLIVGDLVNISRIGELRGFGIFPLPPAALGLDGKWEKLFSTEKRAFPTQTWRHTEKGIILESTLEIRRINANGEGSFLFDKQGGHHFI